MSEITCLESMDLALLLAGSHNNINVLHRSLVFARLVECDAPLVNYEINGHPYNKCYYLVDDIYPEWSTFVKTIHEPREEKKIEGLPSDMRHVGRLWSVHLVCSNLGGLLLATL
jgi:hypothetical protein